MTDREKSTGSTPQGGSPNDESPTRVYRVLDMINTDRSAKELLDCRVTQVNATGRYQNDIYCTSGEWVEKLRAKGHTVHVVDTPRGVSLVKLAVATLRTIRLLRKERFDAVHTHGSLVALLGHVAAFIARTPVTMFQVHGWWSQMETRPVRRWLRIKSEWLTALFADVMLFQNQKDIDACLRERIAPRRKLNLIGNGVRLDLFHPAAEPPGNDPPVMLCVGRLEPVKNHPMLFEAVRLLKERGVDFVLKLAGDGAGRPEYEVWVREHGLSEQVRFLGYTEDVPALTADSEVSVLTSVVEGIPRAVVQAQACGRPMVATDIVGSRDAMIPGVTGFVVPLNDSVALADRLEELLTNRELRDTMGRKGRAHAEAHFDEEAVTRRIIEAYDRVFFNER